MTTVAQVQRLILKIMESCPSLTPQDREVRREMLEEWATLRGQLIEDVQQERDRAQAILALAASKGLVFGHSFLLIDGSPDTLQIAAATKVAKKLL